MCYQKTFAELLAIADRHNCTTIEELQEHVDFGVNCQLCHPYVRRMLKTGETVFSEVMEE